MSRAEKSMFAKGGGSYAQNNQDYTKGGKKDWLHAKNDSPKKLETTFETAYMSTSELEKIINRAFTMIFSDYHGCVVTPEGVTPGRNSNVKVDLYFQPKNPGMYSEEEAERRAFVTIDGIGANGRMTTDDLVMTTTAGFRQNNKNFMLTSYASEILYDFLNVSDKKNINPFRPASYGDHVTEAPNIINNNRVIVCNIDCVDINKILEFVYGSKTESGSKIYYLVTAISPITTGVVPAGTPANWLISIAQMSAEQLSEITKLVGVPNYSGSIRINTEK